MALNAPVRIGALRAYRAAPLSERARELRRRIGEDALRVLWDVVRCAAGGPDGLCHATLHGIGARVGLTPRRTGRMLQRLARVGLLRNLGRLELPVRTVAAHGDIPRLWERRRVYARTTPIGWHEGALAVPAAVLLAVPPPNWGGRREGAGRKPAPMPGARKELRALRAWAGRRGVQLPAPDWSALAGALRATDATLAVGREELLRSPAVLLEARAWSAVQESRSAPYMEEKQTIDKSQGGALARAVSFGRVQTNRSGVVHPWTPENAPGIPPAPPVELSRTPPPPQVPPELEGRALAQLAARTYRACAEHTTRRRCAVLLRRKDLTDKWVATLAGGLEELRAAGIAPAAWCGWSFRVWAAMGKNGPPPLKWVFAASRVKERTAAFGEEQGAWSGGRLVLGPKQRELTLRYQGMQAALSLRGKRTARAVAEQMFGRGLHEYHVLVEEAREEAAEWCAMLAKQAEEGVWLW